MIKVSNLCFTVKGKQILKNITVDIKSGDRIAIVGGNGAGKTTLVETIIGLQKRTSGDVVFDFDFIKSPLEKVGVQFQESNFPLGLSTGQIIEFFLAKTRTPNVELVKKLIKDFGVDSFYDTDASKLSGGQAQKLNVLLALSNNPRIVILDELTTGLDVVAKQIITKAVKEYLDSDKNISLIIVTHTEHEIDVLANRVLVISKGELIQDITPEEILKKHKRTGDFLATLTV